jgi:hypothetical protein
MTRDDVINAMIDRNPRLATAYQAWEVTQDDIYAASLEKYPKIREAHNSWMVDNTQRVQQEAQKNAPSTW